jgi:sugar/nucleoside kinase (ribokinase family)
LIPIPGTILCTGNLVQDTVVYPADRIPDRGTQWVERIEQHLGGNCASSSFAIGILGGRVRPIGCLGNDSFGALIRSKLESVGCDLRFLQTAPAGVSTSASVALVRSDGSRGFLHNPGASREAFRGFEGFNSDQVADCSHYHLANPFALPGFRALAPMALRSARNFGMTTSLDTAWDSKGEWMQVLEPCLPLIDVLFANEDEIRMLTGHAEPASAVQTFRNLGATHVVVKLGPNGSLTFVHGQPEPVATPSFPVQVVDTTGAGDCFVGAFLAGLQRGLDTAAAATLANAAGALNVTALGGVTGLRNYAETVAWMKKSSDLDQ